MNVFDYCTCNNANTMIQTFGLTKVLGHSKVSVGFSKVTDVGSCNTFNKKTHNINRQQSEHLSRTTITAQLA